MRKLAGLLTLLLFCIVPVIAQDAPAQAPAPTPDTSQPPKRIKSAPYFTRYEISGAFAYRSFYAPTGPSIGDTLGMKGWQGSIDYNLNPWIGVVVEATGTYKNQGVDGKTSVYTGMAGGQLYPFKHHKITPFGRVLYGAGYYELAFPSLSPFPSSSITSSSAAWDVGGGVDYFITRNFGIRAIQLDYDKEESFKASRVGYRVSFGVVYRFGRK